MSQGGGTEVSEEGEPNKLIGAGDIYRQRWRTGEGEVEDDDERAIHSRFPPPFSGERQSGAERERICSREGGLCVAEGRKSGGGKKRGGGGGGEMKTQRQKDGKPKRSRNVEATTKTLSAGEEAIKEGRKGGGEKGIGCSLSSSSADSPRRERERRRRGGATGMEVNEKRGRVKGVVSGRGGVMFEPLKDVDPVIDLCLHLHLCSDKPRCCS